MDWRINLMQRDKVALSLGAVFLVIVLANWFMNFSIKQIGGNFKSVYEDRLVPALDIAAITERTYKTHMLLEEYLLTENTDNRKVYENRVAIQQQEIDSLVSKFENTYLTKDEQQRLAKYKLARQHLDSTQHIIFAQSSTSFAAARNAYDGLGKNAFLYVLKPLNALSKIQGTVGHDLLSSAERQMNSIKVLTYLVIGMAIVIALLVTTLLQTSQKLNSIKRQNFHLN